MRARCESSLLIFVFCRVEKRVIRTTVLGDGAAREMGGRLGKIFCLLTSVQGQKWLRLFCNASRIAFGGKRVQIVAVAVACMQSGL